jgi:hypothetical protein
MRVLLLLGVLGAAAGCSDDETATNPDCVDYSSVDTMACGGPCSFANNVMPILQPSCNLSGSCHSNRVANPAGEELALGPPATLMMMPIVPTQMEIDEVHATIVNGTSVRSTLPLVTPGDPSKSWLMIKLEYPDMVNWGDAGISTCQAAFAACDETVKGCGISMPWNSPSLEPDRIAVVRAWIADGAQNN